MKTICIVTGSRAEYGLLNPLIKEIKKSKGLKLNLVVTGSHLSKSFGNTYKEIDPKLISAKIRIPVEFSDKAGMAKCLSTTIDKFTDYFSKNRPDILVVLGDRYEIFGVCIAASMLNIPIGHISGGETTEGAVDEYIRHSITKMSYLHFTECEDYRKRVIQLGENPKRVFNVGALCVDNINNLKELSLNDLSKELNIDLKEDYALVTYHPETIGKVSIKKQMSNLIKALKNYPNMNFIITKANADAGGMIINDIWDEEIKKHSNWSLVYSLGFEKYLTLMRHSKVVIGNSSSGIIEAPVFKKPVVNIGDRQKGRYMCENIMSCKNDEKDIIKSIDLALSSKFEKELRNVKCPYGNGTAAKKIVKILERELKNEIDLKKKFYDIEY